jgi:hypothetical protein
MVDALSNHTCITVECFALAEARLDKPRSRLLNIALDNMRDHPTTHNKANKQTKPTNTQQQQQHETSQHKQTNNSNNNNNKNNNTQLAITITITAQQINQPLTNTCTFQM